MSEFSLILGKEALNHLIEKVSENNLEFTVKLRQKLIETMGKKFIKSIVSDDLKNLLKSTIFREDVTQIISKQMLENDFLGKFGISETKINNMFVKIISKLVLDRMKETLNNDDVEEIINMQIDKYFDNNINKGNINEYIDKCIEKKLLERNRSH